MPVHASLRQLVLERDRYRCAYCLAAQENSGQRLQIDHIIPVAAGGPTALDNLCACCASCNNTKWARTEAIDPPTGEPARLFHPLRDSWPDHFAWDETGSSIIGLTARGRATVEALQMNNATIVRARRRWIEAGWHPPR